MKKYSENLSNERKKKVLSKRQKLVKIIAKCIDRI